MKNLIKKISLSFGITTSFFLLFVNCKKDAENKEKSSLENSVAINTECKLNKNLMVLDTKLCVKDSIDVWEKKGYIQSKSNDTIVINLDTINDASATAKWLTNNQKSINFKSSYPLIKKAHLLPDCMANEIDNQNSEFYSITIGDVKKQLGIENDTVTNDDYSFWADFDIIDKKVTVTKSKTFNEKGLMFSVPFLKSIFEGLDENEHLDFFEYDLKGNKLTLFKIGDSKVIAFYDMSTQPLISDK